jgi:hypothetical protein
MHSTTTTRDATFAPYRAFARQLRAVTGARYGNATRGLLAGALMAVLPANYMRYGVDRPERTGNDNPVVAVTAASAARAA